MTELRLSTRQIEVLRFMALGASTKEAAFEMKIARHTVEYHRARLKKTYNLKSQAELIRFAVDNGFVKKGEIFVATDSRPKINGQPIRVLGTGKLIDSLVLAGDKIASGLNEREIADPVSVDSLVKITDCLVNVARLQLQLEDRKLEVTWLNNLKKIN